MANSARGETSVVVDGVERTLCLTLGGLASLEARFGGGGLIALADRFESGGFGADDLIALLTEGFRGAGWDVTEEQVSAMDFERGAIGAAEASSRLLSASFRGLS